MKKIIENLQVLIDSILFTETEHSANYIMSELDKGLLIETLNEAMRQSLKNSEAIQIESIEFAEWLRTFDALDKDNGFWVVERQLSSEELYYHYLHNREQWRKFIEREK